MFHRRPSERHSPTFFTAERPVCVPYKRKGTTPNRQNRRAAAPAASATVNIQKITKRAFDGRTQHRLELLLRVISIRQFYVSPSTDCTAFAHVFHRGTPGVRSLQAERRSKTSGRMSHAEARDGAKRSLRRRSGLCDDKPNGSCLCFLPIFRTPFQPLYRIRAANT